MTAIGLGVLYRRNSRTIAIVLIWLCGSCSFGVIAMLFFGRSQRRIESNDSKEESRRRRRSSWSCWRGLAYANLGLKRTTGVAVTVEKIEARDLEAIVSASGKIQPKRSVNISAETMGKVVEPGGARRRHASRRASCCCRSIRRNLETHGRRTAKPVSRHAPVAARADEVADREREGRAEAGGRHAAARRSSCARAACSRASSTSGRGTT